MCERRNELNDLTGCIPLIAGGDAVGLAAGEVETNE
jgi:hypothetical protein